MHASGAHGDCIWWHATDDKTHKIYFFDSSAKLVKPPPFEKTFGVVMTDSCLVVSSQNGTGPLRLKRHSKLTEYWFNIDVPSSSQLRNSKLPGTNLQVSPVVVADG
jgi:hypothetical protein